MKVLLIDVNCKYSSTGKIVYDLHQDLTSQGHIASVAYGRGEIIHEPLIFKYGINIETYFHALMTRLTGLTGYFSPYSTHRLLKHIKNFKPDVVHLHDLHGYHLNIGRLIKYLKINNIKTIWTFHSEFMYTGKCGHAKTCENFKTECHDCPLLKEYPKSLFFDFTRFMHREKKEWFSEFEKNLSIVAPSKWMEERIRISFLKNFEIKCVPNGIDTRVFNYKKTDSLRSNSELKNKILFLSVIAKPDDPNKGFKWILDYSKKVHEEVVFVVVGKNFPKNLPKNIHVIDYVTNVEKLATLYRECDAYLMVSEYENYPTVCLEASATSLPIVGFDSGGVSETTIGNSAILFPYGSPELLETINGFEPQERKMNDKLHLLDQETMRNRYYEIYQH